MVDSRQQRVLIVGVGSIGERHVRCFQATGRADVAICEIDDRLREQVARRYGIDESFASLEQARHGAYDAAVICTPAHLHVAQARQLADHGAHLLIEKPLSTSLDGIDELQRVVADRDRVAVVAYVLRNHPLLAAMKQALESGRFGTPVQLVAVSGQHFPTYRPAYRQIYYADRRTGGGAIQDALTHMLNAGEWLVGPVTQVCADAAHQVLADVTVEDTAHVVARHGTVLGSYCLNQYQPANETTITVNCREGMVRFEGHRQRWRWMVEPGGEWHDECAAELQRDDLFVAQAHALLDTIAGNSPPLCTLDEAIQTLRVNLAILASIEDRSWHRPGDNQAWVPASNGS